MKTGKLTTALFNSFDQNSSGKISHGSLLSAMRRAWAKSPEVQVHEIINKLDDGSGHITFNEFCMVMIEKNEEVDMGTNYKETYRVFSKDALGCISADIFISDWNCKFFQVKQKEIEEMLSIMDKNGAGKVSYSEFRVLMGVLVSCLEKIERHSFSNFIDKILLLFLLLF